MRRLAAASVVVRRPALDVWSLIADVGSMMRWDPGVEAIEASGPLSSGATFTITARVLGRRVADARVEAFDPGRRIAWKVTSRGSWATASGSWVKATYVTDPLDSSTTRLTRVMDGEAHGPLVRLATPLLLWKARRERSEEISNIKALLENLER